MHHQATDHRRAAAGVLVPLALALVLAGCGSVGTGAASQERVAATTPEERVMDTDLPATPAPGALECGARVPPVGGPLSMTGRFPESVPPGAQRVDGTVVVTARTAAGRATGSVVTPRAETFLVRDGMVVTLPLAQDAVGRRVDLSEGRQVSLDATVGLVPCSGGGTLAPGTYDVYARVVLSLEDGSRADTLAGPWPLQVQ